MKSYGHLDLQQNELQHAALQVENNFPSIPVVGRLVFKDSVLYICIEITQGTPVWIPLTNEIDSFAFDQTSALDLWNINHNLNTTLPAVQVYGDDHKAVIPDSITIVDNNNVIVGFGSPMSGRAIVLSGYSTGKQRQQSSSFEFTQTNPSTSWTIVHNLGYIPIVRIFVGNQEIFPASITFDNNFQLTVNFDQPYVGIARLV